MIDSSVMKMEEEDEEELTLAWLKFRITLKYPCLIEFLLYHSRSPGPRGPRTVLVN